MIKLNAHGSAEAEAVYSGLGDDPAAFATEIEHGRFIVTDDQVLALPILAEVAPVPVAILAFAEGAAGIHHAWRVHKLAARMEGTDVARQILGEIEDRIDQLDGERAEALLELLMRDYRG